MPEEEQEENIEEDEDDSELEEIVEKDEVKEIAEEISEGKIIPEKIRKTPEFDSSELMTFLLHDDSTSPVLEQVVSVEENPDLETTAETASKPDEDSKVDYDSSAYDANKYSDENKYEREDRSQEFEIREGVGKDLGLQQIEKDSRNEYVIKNRENSENFDAQKYHSRKFK